MGVKHDADDSDWAGLGDEKRRAGFEWGLGALLMSCSLLLAAPIQLLVNLQLSQLLGQGINAAELAFYTIAAWFLVLGILTTCILAFSFAVRGLRRTLWFDQPAGIPVAAIVVSILALLAWVVVGYNLIATLSEFA